MTRRDHSQAGMTLIEVMVTLLIVVVGVLSTLGTYVHFSSATRKARQKTVLTSVAQREMEQLRPISFANLGLTTAPSATEKSEAPLTGAAATEATATGGIVVPGGSTTNFSYQGVSGRIYRYVTYYSETCTSVTAKVQTQLAGLFGQTQAQITAALPALCATTGQTKRLTVVVVPTGVNGGVATGPGVRLSTVVGDTSATAPQIQNLASLAVKNVAGTNSTPATSDPNSTQTLYLTDTRCSSTGRTAPATHATRDTSQAGFTCAASGPAPTLMTLAGIPGTSADPVFDFSSDVVRAAIGGLAMLKDTQAGSCTSSDNLVYTNADANTRMHAIHTWATTVPTAAYETPLSGGRADLSVWSSTADGLKHAGRLCVTLRRASTGQVLGSSDFSLASWPTVPTQLDTTFDLDHVALPAGERLLLTLRVPSDSKADIRILYDHFKYSSSLTFQTIAGKELK